MWKISSPGKTLGIELHLDEKGTIQYQIFFANRQCANGVLGITTSLADFTQGLMFTEQDIEIAIDESYSLPVGKKDVYINQCIEKRIHFCREGVPLILTVRAYENGAAFRYEIPLQGSGFSVMRENTDFCFPDAYRDVWLQDWTATYEAPYNKCTWGPNHNDRNYAMPVLVGNGTAGPWLMVNEAAVLNTGGNYCVSHLKGTCEHRLTLDFAPEEKGRPISTVLPFVSPWRYLLVADTLNDVVNSTLNYNLNPPSTLKDTSWIKPARALWAWWISDTGAQLFTEVKQYVDYAAAIGFEAVVVDAGWDNTWMPQFCAYAHERGISPWLWTAMQDVDTEEKGNFYFPLWKNWGVDGVKIDIFENDSAHTAWQYNMIADIMAREQLMVNFHGCTKPMGEGRTWPHFVAAEGIMGLEYYKWSNGPDAEHNCTVPFIRNAVGPMDYTPTGFTNKNRNTSMAHQVALSAVFESGCTHISASIFNLEAWNGTDFLRRLKPKYDGLRLLSGYPGEYVTMLRWVQATHEYIVGCICNDKRILHLSFDFLPDGIFEAEIYRDDRFGDNILVDKLEVTNSSYLDIPMVEHGGAGLYLARKITPLTVLRAKDYMCGDYTELSAEKARASLGSIHSVISEENSAKVLMLQGSAEFICKESIPREAATIRLFYSAEEAFALQISDGITTMTVNVPRSGYHRTFSTYDFVFSFAGGPTKITLINKGIVVPALDKIRIIRNKPSQGIVLPVETGIVSNGAQLQPDPCGSWRLCGMENGASLRFPCAMIPQSGEYILRINYYAGVTGTVKVVLHDGQVISARLNGLSKWSSVQPNELIAREILVVLQAGVNRIDLIAAETLPLLKEIVLTPNV